MRDHFITDLNPRIYDSNELSNDIEENHMYFRYLYTSDEV